MSTLKSIVSPTRLLSLALLALIGLSTADSALAQSPRAGTGEVLSIRELRLKPGVDPAEFERFVKETYNPRFEQLHFPGWRGYILKADRGTRKGSYIHVYAVESERTRNAFFPTEEGVLSEKSAPLAAELLEEVRRLNQELERYVEPGWHDVYTDYVVLR